MRPFLVQARCAFAPHRLPALTFAHAWARHVPLPGDLREKFFHLVDRMGVEHRAFFRPLDLSAWVQTAHGDASAFYHKHQSTLLARTARDVLRTSGISPSAIGRVVSTYDGEENLPGITWETRRVLRLRDDCERVDVRGQWCGGGVRSLALASEYLQLHPDRCALVLSAVNGSYYVTSSLWALHGGCTDVVSKCVNALWGNDACGVLLLTGARFPRPSGPALQLVRYSEVNVKEPEEGARLAIGDDGQQLSLPTQNIAEHVGKILKRLVPTDSDCELCVHPGGRMVIDAVAAHCGIPRDRLWRSVDCLEWGNNTSSTIPFMLERLMKEPLPSRRRVFAVAQGLGSLYGMHEMIYVN